MKGLKKQNLPDKRHTPYVRTRSVRRKEPDLAKSMSQLSMDEDATGMVLLLGFLRFNSIHIGREVNAESIAICDEEEVDLFWHEEEVDQDPERHVVQFHGQMYRVPAIDFDESDDDIEGPEIELPCLQSIAPVATEADNSSQSGIRKGVQKRYEGS